VQELGLSVCELQFDTVVSTLTSGLVRKSSLCARCPIIVEFSIDLVPRAGLV